MFKQLLFGMVGLAVAIEVPGAAFPPLPYNGKITSASLGAELDEGIYRVVDNVTLSAAGTTNAALRIKKNATVCIFVCSNKTFTVQGGAGSGMVGGGAGIRLPEGSELILTGIGTVKVTGGNAADGGKGENGRDATTSRGGYGGDGGDGGGGSGAAIGGSGGRGGNGGNGGRVIMFSEEDGDPGTLGTAGENCGTLTILGQLKVQLTGGSEGGKGADGTAGADVGVRYVGGHGGLGGLGGYAMAYGFAMGGHGGGGGGGGGSGYATSVGDPTTDGITPTWDNDDRDKIGTLKVSKNVVVNLPLDSPTVTKTETHAQIQGRIRFDDAEIRRASGTAHIADVIATLGVALPSIGDAGSLPVCKGWYTGPDGTGVKYYNGDGTPALPCLEIAEDVVLHAYCDWAFMPTGVYINDKQIDGSDALNGWAGPGWQFNPTNRLVKLSAAGDAQNYTIRGSNDHSVIHFDLVGNGISIGATNLYLHTATTNKLHSGIFAVPSGCSVEFALSGENTFDASEANGVAGIFCPTGATVKLRGKVSRSLEWAEPTDYTYMGLLTHDEGKSKSLVVKGGAGAAAIGGRSGAAGGLSGAITIDNCSVWADGGSKACEMGPGTLATGVNSNLCATIHFLNHPNVRRSSQQKDAKYPLVYPSPHGEWETPLFPRSVDAGSSFYNVYWFPYGTTKVQKGASGTPGFIQINHTN